MNNVVFCRFGQLIPQSNCVICSSIFVLLLPVFLDNIGAPRLNEVFTLFQHPRFKIAFT